MAQKKDEGLNGNEKIEQAVCQLQQEPTQEQLAHTPVSYTHLDVYKRQVMDGDLDGFIFAYLKAASRGELQDT